MARDYVRCSVARRRAGGVTATGFIPVDNDVGKSLAAWTDSADDAHRAAVLNNEAPEFGVKSSTYKMLRNRPRLDGVPAQHWRGCGVPVWRRCLLAA